jgi:NHLM bacteriocin system ABC transporter ATP-binding protein
MHTVHELIESINPALPAEKQFWLDEPHTLCLVKSGALDIFLQRRDAQGLPTGARHHVYRVLKGQLAIGLDFSQLSEGWGAIAVRLPGTTVSRITNDEFARAFFIQEVNAQAVGLISDWVAASALGVAKPMPPRQYRVLQSGTSIETEAQEILSPGVPIVWACVRQGLALWQGQAGFAVDEHSAPIPLTRENFLLTECKVLVELIDPLALAKDGAIWPSMQLHLRFVLSCALLANDEIAHAESVRLQAMDGASLIQTREALSRLMGIGQKQNDFGAKHEKEARLLEALKSIGDRQGIVFQFPPASDYEALERNPVETVCGASDIRYRQVALKEAWWTTDNGPLLGTIGDSREWVALLPVADMHYEVYNPASDQRLVINEDVAQTLGAVGYAFYRPFPGKALNALDLLKFGVHGLRRDVYWVLGLSMLVGLLGMMTPIATGSLIDTLIPSADVPAIWQLVGALFAAALASTMFQIANSIAMLRIESKMDGAVQSAVWDRVLKLPVPFFRLYSTGDLAMRINGINTIRHALSGATVHTLLTGIFSLFNFFLLFYYSVKLAGVATVMILGAVMLTVVIGFMKLRYERQLAEVMGKLSGATFQYLQGITKIRVASAESRVFSRWAEQYSNFRRISFQSQHLANIEHTFFAGYPLIITASFFAVMGMFLFKEEATRMSVGQFIAFNAAFGAFFGGIISLIETCLGLLNLIPVYERAKPILHATPEVSESKVHPGTMQGRIEVAKLGFQYGEGAQILKDVSFTAQPGEYIALVGPSGSGKSTLLRLLLGFEQATSGTIYYDNLDIVDLDLNALRRQFGVVLQSGQLMPADIFNNIVGSSNLTLEDAWEAARMVGLDEDIKKMPMGMYTVISDGASTFSGGQRQRIMIARAIVHRPRILFFDEATSALDNNTQAIVTASLDQMKATRIVIAHRLSTVIKADRILVLQDGRIVQDGNYKELIAVPGLFQDLATRQIA